MYKLFIASALFLPILLPIFGSDSVSAANRGEMRTIEVVSVKGNAHVQKAGATQSYSLFLGYHLMEGDRVTTESGASVILEFSDRKHEITLDERTDFYIPFLRNRNGEETHLKVISGNVYTSVEKLSEKDQFYVETSSGVMDVKGTQFLVTIDPITGRTTLGVVSGVVDTSTGEGTRDIPIYPSMQAFFPEYSDQLPTIMDPDFITQNVSQAVIEAMLRNRLDAQQENEEFIQQQQNQLDQMGQDLLDFNDGSWDQIEHNLSQLISVLAGRADSTIDFRVDHTSELMVSDEQQRKLQEVRQLQMAEQRRMEELERQRRETQKIAENIFDQLQQERERLEEQNRQAAQKMQQEAIERYLGTVSSAERERIGQERKRSELPSLPSTPRTSSGGSGGGSSRDRDNDHNPPANQAPTIVNPIGNKTLILGEDVQQLDVSNVFSDPDQDELTYEISSSDSDVIHAYDDGGFYIQAKEVGTAEVTVTATDPHGASVSVTFTVTVQEPMPINNTPVVAQPIDDRTLTLGEAATLLDLIDVFTDADGDELTYEISSSNSDIVIVHGYDDGGFYIQAEGVGTAEVTVTATDPHGASVSATFTVTVQKPMSMNNPPVVVLPIEDYTLTWGDEDIYLDLFDVFWDEDGDELTYEISSSNLSIVHANDDGGVYIQAKEVGTAEVTVTATDPHGASVSVTFTVTVSN